MLFVWNAIFYSFFDAPFFQVLLLFDTLCLRIDFMFQIMWYKFLQFRINVCSCSRFSYINSIDSWLLLHSWTLYDIKKYKFSLYEWYVVIILNIYNTPKLRIHKILNCAESELKTCNSKLIIGYCCTKYILAQYRWFKLAFVPLFYAASWYHD